MYGFIYNTLKKLVIENCGEETWNDVCDEAEAEVLKENIVIRNYYDESILMTISNIAARRLDVPLEAILELFGAFFFRECKLSGHSSMLRTLGHNLYGFLMNLDSLHDHLSFTYTQMRAPSFRCEKTHSGLTLHYYSRRPGLSSIVVGIVKEVAKDFFDLDVDIKVLLYEETPEKLSHHYTFQVSVKDKTDESYLERLTGDIGFIPSPGGSLTPVDDEHEMVFQPTQLTLSHQAPVLIDVSSPQEKTHPNSMGCPFSMTTRTNSEGCPVSGRSQSTGQMIADPQLLAEIHLNNQDSPQLVHQRQPRPEIGITDRTEIEKQLAGRGMYMPHPVLPALSHSRVQSRRGSTIPTESIEWPISPNVFQHCFPFHIIFDHNLVIRYMGISLARLFPKAIVTEAKLTDFFELSRPAMKLTYTNIRASISNVFIISTNKRPITSRKTSSEDDGKDALQFRGQMVPTSSRENAAILFLASPRISSIKELEHQGLYLSDIPIHDVTRDLILLNRHFQVEMSIARELEETKHDLQIQKDRVDEEKKRADELLHAMLPKSVANDLKSRVEARAIQYPEVTILFSDIKGFTVICSKSKPMQVVGMLNSLYTLFDSLLEKHNVYKVETIGDAYMVASGLLDTASRHAEAVTNMAFDMRADASKVMEPVHNQPLQIRIGIHTGPVVAGVVGIKMPRYCLFGDTVNTASRMESHGEPGYVHISSETYSFLEGKPFIPYSRGLINIKGLGERQTYFIEPAVGELSNAPSRVILVQPETADRENAKISVTSQSSAVSSVLELDSMSRSPSFVEYDEIRRVNLQSSTKQEPMGNTLSPKTSTSGLVMKHVPRHQKRAVRSPSPLLETEVVSTNNGQNGVVRTSLNQSQVKESSVDRMSPQPDKKAPSIQLAATQAPAPEKPSPPLAVKSNKTVPVNSTNITGESSQLRATGSSDTVSEDGRVSRTSMNSATALFITKNTDSSTENIADDGTRGSHSSSSTSSTESKRRNRGKCIIS